MSDITERQRLEFLPGVAGKLGWYVYALRDPRDRTVFYVGKGKGSRAYQHARASLRADGDRNLKLKQIQEIRASGREVVVEVVRYRLSDEKIAYLVEAAVIDALTIGQPANLKNPIAGHGDRWSSLEQLRHLAAPPVDIRPEHRPCILIRPVKKYREGGSGYNMTADELWEITRGGWTFRRRDNHYKYAFCVHDGIVRGVWQITGWDENEEHWGKGRRGLVGEQADDTIWKRYVGKHVGHYLPARGGQLPYTLVRQSP